MTAVVAGLVAVSLTLLAFGLLLWQHAQLRARQNLSAAFVDGQIKNLLWSPHVEQSEPAVSRSGPHDDAP
ncbi:MAG: hypothetical protein ACREX0_02380, partial [Noviherbaspirillum sp.]